MVAFAIKIPQILSPASTEVNERIREVWGNFKASRGKEVEIVWTCDEMRRGLFRKEGKGNRSTNGYEEG